MGWTLSEDWLATLIGLAIVAIITLGLLGPGPQTVTVKVAPGEAGEMEVKALDGWKPTALLAKEEVPIAQAATEFHAEEYYSISCEEDALTMRQSIGASSNSENAVIGVANNCDASITITYKTDQAILWPLFGILDKK